MNNLETSLQNVLRIIESWGIVINVIKDYVRMTKSDKTSLKPDNTHVYLIIIVYHLFCIGCVNSVKFSKMSRNFYTLFKVCLLIYHVRRLSYNTSNF